MKHFELKTNTKTNGIALGVLALLAVSVFFLGNTVVKDVSRDAEQASAGIVAGAKAVRQEVTVSIIGGAQNRQMTFDLTPGATALDLMLRAGQRENFAIETKQYDFGTIVEAIEGTRGGDEGRYWLYYVNGEQATVGADAYLVKSGDLIEFRFE